MKYNIIYADPPWKYADNRSNKSAGMARSAYETMSQKELFGLLPQINEWADKQCALFLWTPMPKLPQALELINAWNFVYCTAVFVWIKLNPTASTNQHIAIPRYEIYKGIGHYTRANAELVLLARRGPALERKDLAIPQVFAYPRGAHSAKPPIVRDKIVQLFGDLPRIELFARERVEGWDSWGDEIDVVISS